MGEVAVIGGENIPPACGHCNMVAIAVQTYLFIGFAEAFGVIKCQRF